MSEIIRRRVLSSNGQSIVNPYISNGLIFWLDGIYKNQSVGIDWEDLIGGVQFRGVVDNTDNFLCGGGLKSESAVLPADENYTVEIVMMFDANSPNMPILSCGNKTTNKICVAGYGSNKFAVLQNQTAWVCNMTKNVKHVFSVNLTRCLQDYQEITSQSTSESYYNEPDDGWYITRRTITKSFNIYCIRIYNRQLTLDEMKSNQAVDNSRFNLGLTISE